MRVLIAEDERITRVSLTRQLESWGHIVTATEDGEQAWEKFSSAEFDIVITDWEMPRLSGLELIQRIRGQTAANYVYLIMLTGRTNKADLVGGIEAGADDFVAKPFDKEELRVRLLAGERVVRLERTLSVQNVELRAAGERMRHDLQAAARVQRAMLPKHNITTPHVSTAWTYVPTDELAGDAVGLTLIDDRYLVTYVIDVSGHGVPAALLSVTAMHALSPTSEGAALLRDRSGTSGMGTVQRPFRVVSELNRRFSTSDNDGRFLTMILCVFDTHEGRLHYSRAGHPLPVVLRAGKVIQVADDGGLPIGVMEGAEYEDVVFQLEPGDRVFLLSDGFLEQMEPTGHDQYGERRFEAMLLSHGLIPGEQLVLRAVDALAEWAGGRKFADDVSLIMIEWPGR